MDLFIKNNRMRFERLVDLKFIFILKKINCFSFFYNLCYVVDGSDIVVCVEKGRGCRL